MTRALASGAAIAVVLTLGASRAEASPDTGRQGWWRAPAVQTELRLTAAQVKALDAEYRRSLPTRLALRRNLDTLEGQLARTLEAGIADESAAAALIARVEDARCQRNQARTLMLVAMYRLLSPPQRLRLAELVRRGNPIHAAARAAR